MSLKNFQQLSINALEYWLDALPNFHDQLDNLKRERLIADAWLTLHQKYPNRSTSKDRSRKDAGNRPFPHACLKIPTGGGKTFTATYALTLIMRKQKRKQTGLVLWIVHSKAIYEQTLETLEKKRSWVHQRLKHLSGNRLKIFTKYRQFSKQDISTKLCIMLIMVQSTVSGANKERLRFERMVGNYKSFFPDIGNILKNKQFINKHHGLKCIDQKSIPIPSLANTIRVCRPVVIVDESHRTDSAAALKEISRLNPSIVFEISATPSSTSNVLYTASGREVWEDEMIKLPVNLYHNNTLSWKETLKRGYEKRNELERVAQRVQLQNDVYIRPIMVIRVVFTGKNQIEKTVHAYQARDYLVKILRVPSEHVAIQSNVDKDLKGKNLLSKNCQIRYIITRDALKEGWDCPFACVLTILSNFKTQTGVTQLLGRVMRQPYGRRVPEPHLNKPYVFCSSEDSQKTILSIKKELEAQGYTDVKDLFVEQSGESSANAVQRVKTYRRPRWKNCKFYFPKFKFVKNGITKIFDYDRDLLPLIDWKKIKYDNSFQFISDQKLQEQYYEIGIEGLQKNRLHTTNLSFDRNFDLVYLTERLLDIIPNIFVAARIINSALKHYTKRILHESVFAQRLALVEHIRTQLQKTVQKKSRDIFDKLIREGTIDIKFTEKFNNHNWEMPEFDFYKKNREDMYNQDKYFFEEINTSSMNELEKKAARSFEEANVIDWWFRTTAKSPTSGYFLQGWKRERVYPDFILALHLDRKGKERFMVIETKGDFLAEGDDAEYKKELMKIVENKNRQHYFRVVEEGEWDTTFNCLIEQA